MSIPLRRERPLRRIGFLHLVPFTEADPAAGLRDALDLFAYAESLGFDSGWVRTRHLQYGAPAPAVMLTALAGVTTTLELGNAVIPLEFENPRRFAEDFAVADLLSGGRLRPGLSVHPPRYAEETNNLVFGEGWRQEDYSYGRIELLLELLRGQPVRELGEYQGFGGDFDAATVQPQSPGLADRLSYGAGSLRSAAWAGQAGLGLLVSNISSAENGITDFNTAQANQMRAFRAAHPAGEAAHVAQARVVVPLDGASPEQAARYTSYVEARNPRTRGVVGEKTIIAPDVLGTVEEIVRAYAEDESFALADEVIFELPFELEPADWRHILHQLATRVGPALGWTPRG